jgi:mRNA interferase RelE/StbE
VSRLIVAKIEQYAKEPSSLAAQVTILRGREGFRLRVGDWRVIFDEDEVMIVVNEIGPRGSIYEP